MEYGFLSITPLVLMILLAVITKKVLEPAIISTLAAFIISDKLQFFGAWVDGLEAELSNFGYYAIVFGAMGILIRLLMNSKSVIRFAEMLARFIKSKKSALMVTWLAGILIFADDYINSLGVGTSMRTLTDRYKVSREFLAYVVNSTGAVVCTLIPMSTWGVFMISQFEKYPVSGSSMRDYLHSIPFMFYCWAALLIVPLFIFKIIPVFGKMKNAELRAETTGRVFPDGCGPMEEVDEKDGNNSTALDFIVPMLLFVILGIVWGNLPRAIIVAILACGLLYIPRKIMTFEEFMQGVIGGIQDMIPVMTLLVFVFLLGTASNDLGAADYITSILGPLMHPSILPFVTFLGVSLLAIGTGSFWGSAAIALPIFLELGTMSSANPYFIFGAAASAITLASHISFWNDAVLLTCTATEIRSSDYLQTSIPLISLPLAIAAAGYLALGFIG